MRTSHVPRAGSLAPRTRTTARMFEFSGVLEPPQRVAPHPLEQLAEGAERVAAGPVEAVAARDADLHEPGALQRSQLLRDGAEGHVRHRAVDLARAAFPIPHQPQNLL